MKHWIFDLDGTLVDSFSYFFEAMSEIFASHGEEFTEKDKLDTLNMPLKKFLQLRMPGGPHELVLSEIQARSIHSAGMVRPFPGVEECLRELSGRGRPMAIWTGRDLASANKIVEACGWDKYFSVRVGGGCAPQAKPSADGLRLAMQRLKCEAREVVMIGDHEHDVLAAREVGAFGVRASWNGFSSVDRCDHAHENFTAVAQFHGWLRDRS